MRYLLTAAEMKKYDANTMERIGIPSLVLMERAALTVLDALKQDGQVVREEKVLILAGCGNNGADGLALARLLSEAGMIVRVWIMGNPAKATVEWKTQYGILRHYPVEFCTEPKDEAYHVIVDALFGVGLSREITGECAAALKILNAMRGHKVAVDVPSGLGSDDGQIFGTAFRADLTVTFGFEKRGLWLYPGRNYAGRIVCANIGISERAFFGENPEAFYLDDSFEKLLPERKKDGNKGTFGKALIVAGQRQMAGAAILCTRACLAVGTGMAKTLTHSENRTILQETVPEAMFGTVDDLMPGLDWCDAICIGPGLGKNEDAKAALRIVLTHSVKPILLDADALNVISEDFALADLLREAGENGRQIIMTPHLGELKRLYDGLMKQKAIRKRNGLQTCNLNEICAKETRLNELCLDETGAKEPSLSGISMEELKRMPWQPAKELAEYFHAVVVAKDARTYVCAQDKAICINLSGNSGMATAGSGDVLAGILTGLVCQGLPVYEAACRGVRLHGLAGDEASGEFGEHGMMAGDIVEAIRKMGGLISHEIS